MSFRLSSRRICLGAASVAVAALLVCSAQGADRHRGRSIEFSEPRSDEVTNNLHQLTSKKDGLQAVGRGPLQAAAVLRPKSSLEGVVAPPPPPQRAPVIQSKRVKELLERRKELDLHESGRPDDRADCG